MPGCGDSLLSEKLVSQMGFENVVSVDFEPDVVARMNARGAKGVVYEVVDITQMQYESGSFASILDKGTFDALCVDMKPETTAQCRRYLAESVRVLDEFGSFLAVSLLQDFVMDTLLEFFAKGPFDVRVYAIQPAGSTPDKGPMPSQPGTLSVRVRYLPFLLDVKKNASGPATFQFKAHLGSEFKACTRDELVQNV